MCYWNPPSLNMCVYSIYDPFQTDPNLKFWTDTCGCSHSSHWKQTSHFELVKTSSSINKLLHFYVVWKRLTDQGPEEALRYLHFQKWMVQLWLLTHQLETWVTPVFKSLRNNICLHGAISSLCTYGNTESLRGTFIMVQCHTVPGLHRKLFTSIIINIMLQET